MGRAHEVRAASMAKTAAAKSAKNAKHAKAMYVACKKGGSANPEANLEFKAAILRAKKDKVPNSVIENVIKKFEGGTGEEYTSYRYEGYGPAGTAVIVDCLSDNVNRTVAAVKNCFTKTGGNLGVNGSVSYLFDSVSMISVEKASIGESDLFELLLDNDIDISDVYDAKDSSGEDKDEEVDVVTVIGKPSDYNTIKSIISDNCPEVVYTTDELSMLPQNEVTLDDEALRKFERFYNFLDELEDVQRIYHNVKNF